MGMWLLLLVAGVMAGFLIAAASSGSAITLPLLLALGLPPAVANGTNRLPSLVASMSAIVRFQRSKVIPWQMCLRLLPVFLISSLLGALLAVILPMEQIRVLINIAIVLAMVMLLLKPQRWLDEGDPARVSANPSPLLLLLTAGVGLWAGLIILDSSTYLLMSLVLVGGMDLQQANAVKAVMGGAATLVSLMVFISTGNVDWGASTPLMLGSALGGWLGASVALGPHARTWIYRLLVGALALEIVAMLLGQQHPAMWMLMP